MLSRIALALTTSEVGRADWLPNFWGSVIYRDATMTPSQHQLPIMTIIATSSLSRLAMHPTMSEQIVTFPTYSPKGGVLLI